VRAGLRSGLTRSNSLTNIQIMIIICPYIFTCLTFHRIGAICPARLMRKYVTLMFEGCLVGARMPKISIIFGVRDGYKPVRYLTGLFSSGFG